MRPVRLLSVALGALVMACGEPSGPSSSSSSHWLSCEQDSDCDNLAVPASCGGDGYCVSSTGKIEQSIVFEDDFDGETLDADSFAPEIGFSVRNGDAEYYTDRPENLTLQDGELVLTARAEAYEEAMFTSASIETRGLHSWTYGRFEARILAPSGRGTGPAFWLYPESGAPVRVCSSASDCTEGTWPAWGDIVVMTVRSEQPNEILHTSSYATPDDALGELTRGQGGGTTSLATPVSADYHDYAVLWGPQRIDWFVDGELQATLDTTSADIHHPEGINPFTQPFHLKLSLAVGGLSEAPFAADYPQEMRVDWVRVTQFE